MAQLEQQCLGGGQIDRDGAPFYDGDVVSGDAVLFPVVPDSSAMTPAQLGEIVRNVRERADAQRENGHEGR